MPLRDALRGVIDRVRDADEVPQDLPLPGVGEQQPDDPATIPPDVGDMDSGHRP